MNESVYVLCVKCFADIKRHSNCSLWRYSEIEPCGHLVVELVWCCVSGVFDFEHMLVSCVWYVACCVWEKNFFKFFGNGG